MCYTLDTLGPVFQISYTLLALTARPASLPRGAEHLSKLVPSTWYAVQTNPACERRAAVSLRQAGFGVYHPQYRVERFNRRNTVWVTRSYSLIPGYLFVEKPRMYPGEWWGRDVRPSWFRLRRCDGVKGVLGTYDATGILSPWTVPTKQIEIVMLAQAELERQYQAQLAARTKPKNGYANSVVEFPLGSEVRITGEAFQGHTATVENITGRGRIEVLIALFGRMTPFEIEPALVERVDGLGQIALSVAA